jgi:uncharacterized protein (TIGR00730 family)
MLQKITNNKGQTISEEQLNYYNMIQEEYQEAFILINSMPPLMVSIYGGARIKEDSKSYQEILSLGQALAQEGYGVATGGGPGAMKAGLVGAMEANGVSVAVKISINREQTDSIAQIEQMFNNFAPRKYCLRQSDAYVFVPGGWGTFDELFEIITLQKVDKAYQKPIILFDKEFWQDMVKWLETSSLKHGLITKEELDSLFIVDSVKEVIEIIRDTKK